MRRSFAVAMLLLSVLLPASARVQAGEGFSGSWALTLPDGRAGWLGVEEKNGEISAQLLWGGGSVLPVKDVSIQRDTLVLKRTRRAGRRQGARAAPTLTETITAKRAGKTLQLTLVLQRDGKELNRQSFTGKWCPPVGPKPDLRKVVYGKPVVLFNGRDLEGWTLTNPDRANGWSAQNGELVNNPVQRKGERHVAYSNLRTVAEFEDFNLTLEVNVGPGQNSGVYLRGIYEIQVADSYGKPVDSHNMGAVYSRIAPRVSAEKPAGQWQTLDMTLLDRHITVVLNGKTIIDNEPVPGCTGGALWSDPFRPGPIYLQGDHTGIRYRNIVLKPIVKH